MQRQKSKSEKATCSGAGQLAQGLVRAGGGLHCPPVTQKSPARDEPPFDAPCRPRHRASPLWSPRGWLED